MKPRPSDEFTKQEVERRRDALLHSLLKTPPKPRPKRERDKSETLKRKKPKKETPAK
jgi:hypothetical protein